jgi:hypothetical protein
VKCYSHKGEDGAQTHEDFSSDISVRLNLICRFGRQKQLEGVARVEV